MGAGAFSRCADACMHARTREKFTMRGHQDHKEAFTMRGGPKTQRGVYHAGGPNTQRGVSTRRKWADDKYN